MRKVSVRMSIIPQQNDLGLKGSDNLQPVFFPQSKRLSITAIQNNLWIEFYTYNNSNTSQLTRDSEFVQFNEEQSLVPEQHVDASLVKLGSQEDPYCAYLWAIGAVLYLQPLTQGLISMSLLYISGNSQLHLHIVPYLDLVHKVCMMEVREPCKHTASWCKVHTSGKINIILLPECS